LTGEKRVNVLVFHIELYQHTQTTRPPSQISRHG
jgi:hypothetical protein